MLINNLGIHSHLNKCPVILLVTGSGIGMSVLPQPKHFSSFIFSLYSTDGVAGIYKLVHLLARQLVLPRRGLLWLSTIQAGTAAFTPTHHFHHALHLSSPVIPPVDVVVAE